MIKLHLCETGSVLIAAVLLFADCRHIAMKSLETQAANIEQSGSDMRHVLEMELQSRNVGTCTAAHNCSDVISQLSGLSAMVSMRSAHYADTRAVATRQVISP